MPEKSTESEVEREKQKARKIESAGADEPTLPDDPSKDEDEDIFRPLDKHQP